MARRSQLRIVLRDVDRVDEALERDQLIVGWSKAADLTRKDPDKAQFRMCLKAAYPHKYETSHQLGIDVGHLWRFIVEMKRGDLVLVLRKKKIYICRVVGDVEYLARFRKSDTAHRRKVKWLNQKNPLRKSEIEPPLRRLCRRRGVITNASDLLPLVAKVSCVR